MTSWHHSTSWEWTPHPRGGSIPQEWWFLQTQEKETFTDLTFIQRLFDNITCCMVHSGRKGKKKIHFFSDRKVSITRKVASVFVINRQRQRKRKKARKLSKALVPYTFSQVFFSIQFTWLLAKTIVILQKMNLPIKIIEFFWRGAWK